MTDENAAISSSSRAGGDVALLAILLSLCTGAVFVFGSLLVPCVNSATELPKSRGDNNLASLALVLAFATASFVFIGGGIVDLLPLAQSGFEQFVLIEHEGISQKAARGISHLLATTSFAAGVTMLYGVNTVVYRLAAAASERYEDRSVQENRDPPPSESVHHVSLSIVVGGDSRAAGTEVVFGLSSSAAVDFEVLQTSDRPRNAKLLKCTQNTLVQESSATTSESKEAHIRASVISILATVLHHMPAGSIIYISAVNHFQLGEVLAFAVVLHSIPDGKAFTSSIYFASGSQLRGFLWSLLSPVGKLLGSLAAWVFLLRDDTRAFSHCFLSGMAAGVLVAIGVTQVLPAAYSCASDRSYGLVIDVVLGVALLAIPKVFV